MSIYLFVWALDDEHALVLGPKAVLIELLVEHRLPENTAWEVVATVVDIAMEGVELIKVCSSHRPQANGLTVEHSQFLLCRSIPSGPQLGQTRRVSSIPILRCLTWTGGSGPPPSDYS